MNIFSFFLPFYKNNESESESQENIKNSHIHFINNMVEENKDKFIQESMILLVNSLINHLIHLKLLIKDLIN